MASFAPVEPGTHLLFIAKNVERIGDHCANIANTVHDVVNAKPMPDSRPKGADSRSATVEPATETTP